HLRRMRQLYRGRRDALVRTLAEELPDAVVHGIAAGMHVIVELTADDDEAAIRVRASARRIRFETLDDYGKPGGAPVLMLGYGPPGEAATPGGLRELAGAVREARPARSG